jgi:hypothetical protein
LADHLYSEKGYKRRFKSWGLKKNVETESSKRLLGIAKRRRIEENKDTVFTHHPGSKNTKFKHHHRLVKSKNLARFHDRHKRETDPNFSPDMQGMLYQLTCSAKWMR